MSKMEDEDKKGIIYRIDSDDSQYYIMGIISNQLCIINRYRSMH